MAHGGRADRHLARHHERRQRHAPGDERDWARARDMAIQQRRQHAAWPSCTYGNELQDRRGATSRCPPDTTAPVGRRIMEGNLRFALPARAHPDTSDAFGAGGALDFDGVNASNDVMLQQRGHARAVQRPATSINGTVFLAAPERFRTPLAPSPSWVRPDASAASAASTPSGHECMTMHDFNRTAIAGFSLIETMISILILSVGVLGLSQAFISGVQQVGRARPSRCWPRRRRPRPIESVFAARDSHTITWAAAQEREPMAASS